MQQAMFKRGAEDLHAVGQHEGALKAASGDASMQKGASDTAGAVASGIAVAATGNDQLAVIDQDFQLGCRKSGHGQGNAQGTVVSRLHIIGWIGFTCPAGGAFD